MLDIYQVYQGLTTLQAVESIGSSPLKNGQKYEKGLLYIL
ncbi:hypothetical protein SCG7086_AS_00020 [Chlamydiales bacterium SCGC AG-110-P3]|nr:hypothetical protein SCG7086_AS_00020 [Chlamydiales bacterium SCGC AG-110-P3]